MAFASQTRTAQPSLALEISAGILHLVQRVADLYAYRVTLRQLSRLTDSQLGDMGIRRADIRAEVTKAVYGTRG